MTLLGGITPQNGHSQDLIYGFQGASTVSPTEQVFPSESPSSRTDAVMLDNWISTDPKSHVDNGLMLDPPQKHFAWKLRGFSVLAIHLKDRGRDEDKLLFSEVDNF